LPTGKYPDLTPEEKNVQLVLQSSILEVLCLFQYAFATTLKMVWHSSRSINKIITHFQEDPDKKENKHTLPCQF
jgi:hypothetical protein